MRIRGLGWRQFGSGIRDGDSSDPGSGMEKSRIRDKHPDPGHCCFHCLLGKRFKNLKWEVWNTKFSI
jgi:hypothetical protein